MNLIGCGTAQRWWLACSNGPEGPDHAGMFGLGRMFLVRGHLAGCADCRAFARDADALLESAGPLASVEPDPRIHREIHLRAAAELDSIRKRAIAETGRRRRIILVAAPASAAGLLLVLVIPGVFRARPDTPIAIEERLAAIQQELVPASRLSLTVTPRTTLEDWIREMEKQLRCLEIEIDNIQWNSLEGGDQCVES